MGKILEIVKTEFPLSSHTAEGKEASLESLKRVRKEDLSFELTAQWACVDADLRKRSKEFGYPAQGTGFHPQPHG